MRWRAAATERKTRSLTSSARQPGESFTMIRISASIGGRADRPAGRSSGGFIAACPRGEGAASVTPVWAPCVRKSDHGCFAEPAAEPAPSTRCITVKKVVTNVRDDRSAFSGSATHPFGAWRFTGLRETAPGRPWGPTFYSTFTVSEDASMRMAS